MLNLDSTEEIIAILAAVAIIMGFAITTYKEIKTTIAEEKSKAAEIQQAEEKVKELIEEQSGDGWAFERKFRDPLAKLPGLNTDMNKYQIALTTEQQLFLDSIYFKHFPPGP